MSEIDIVKQAVEVLKEEVKRLQILKSNTEADIHSLNIQKENSGKIEEINNRNKLFEIEAQLNVKEDKIKISLDELKRKEIHFEDRIRELEKRENEVVDLSAKKAELNKERSNFNIYKFNIERELENARIIIQEAAQKEEEYKIKSEDLKAREKSIIKQERHWNDAIGKLEQDIKQFEIEHQNKEVVNA